MSWIKLHRSMKKWGWKDSPKHVAVFLDLLLNAQFEKSEYRGVQLMPGQLSTSYKAIALRTGVSMQGVRTVLKHLTSTNEITHESHGHFSVITITNWDKYQGANTPANIELTSNQQPTNTLQEIKNTRTQETTTTNTHPTPRKKPPINPYNLVDVWNELMPKPFPYAKGLSSTDIKNYLESCELLSTREEWEQYFNQISKMDFLRGDNNRGFKAFLNWAVKPEKVSWILNSQSEDGDVTAKLEDLINEN